MVVNEPLKALEEMIEKFKKIKNENYLLIKE